MISFDDLNDPQRRAVEWNDGPLLVLASPGSGKTAVLTLRVVRILEEDEDASALALTFTNKAAAEMRDRVDRHLGQHADRARLLTFHSFAAEILSQHGSHLGIRPDFQVLARDEDRLAILEEVILDLPEGDTPLPADRNNLLQLINRLFSESYPGKGHSPSLPSTPEWLPRLFQRYCEALVAANRLDFGSLLHFAHRLLKEKPAVARVVRLGWTHICVDEFQDTNRAQYDLLRMLAPSTRHNLFVVADDDQIIYEWNGASPKRFSDLSRDYELQTIQLPECYRCPPEIVGHANRLIALNKRLIPSRTTISQRERRAHAAIVRGMVANSQNEEGQLVGRDITKRGLAPASCAVLGRTNRLVRCAAEGLGRSGHEAFVPQSKGEFDSPALSFLTDTLRLANSRHDRVILRRVCREWQRLTGVAIEPHGVGAAAALVGGDFLRAWGTEAEARGAGQGQEVLRRIKTDLVDGLKFPEVVDWFLAHGWQSCCDEGSSEAVEEEVDTWKALHRDILRECGPGLTLNTYLQRLDMSSKTPPAAPNAVQCMTVHRSKGLQFQHIYLIGMAQEVFPSYQALQRGPKSEAVEEERRSCFVAITRAQETLTLTRARKYFGYPKEASQFLKEMGVA